DKVLLRIKRHRHIRRRLSGTAESPRLVIRRSLTNMYAQLIDDVKGGVLLSASTNDSAIKTKIAYRGNIKAAAAFGEMFAKKALDRGIKKVVFDRAGYLYHGRVKAFADSARKGGLQF
ncbi:MAG TPA: 50S ribosomal protein L18, partial [Candidatus Omnitrophota bacterium]|nr:50S ribosomal protein L18 [Candidatus Omnitrophota bacterium]